MINAEKNAVEFFFESLRKHMKKKNRRGVGMAILNNRMLNKMWKPNLPVEFVRSYPKLGGLIRRCWTNETDLRPDFDEIVRLLQGEIHDEIRTALEPEITLLSEEPDEVYWQEATRLAEFKEEEQVEVVEEVSELDAVQLSWKSKYLTLKSNYTSVLAELSAFKKAGRERETVVEAEAVTGKLMTKTKKDKSDEDELAGLLGSMRG